MNGIPAHLARWRERQRGRQAGLSSTSSARGRSTCRRPDVGTGPVPVTSPLPAAPAPPLTATRGRRRHAGLLPLAGQAGGSDAQFAMPAGREDRHLRRSHHGAAKPGDVLILWGTGFGPTDAGRRRRHPGARRQDLQYKPGHHQARDHRCAGVRRRASPGFAGLYQIAIQVPQRWPTATTRIKATVSGALPLRTE